MKRALSLFVAVAIFGFAQASFGCGKNAPVPRNGFNEPKSQTVAVRTNTVRSTR